MEEKLELLEQAQFKIQDIDNSEFDKLHTLVRSKSLERKNDQWNYIARNEARLVAHKKLKHFHVCDLCNNFGNEYGDENF